MRGRKVPLPPHDHRPTSERARQAFFNIAGPVIVGKGFLDLFCGSGIFSLEAVSRGASHSLAIDLSEQATRLLAVRARELAVPIRVMHGDVISVVRRMPPEPFGTIYADPPYDYPRHRNLLEILDRTLVFAEPALLAIEHETGTDPFAGIQLERLDFRKQVRHGNVTISLFDGRPDGP